MRNKREQHARKPPIPREFGRLVPARQEEHGEVVDICAGGAGADEAADALQRGIGIVAPQNIGGVKPGGAPTMTRKQIMAIQDKDERLKAIQDNIKLFEN